MSKNLSKLKIGLALGTLLLLATGIGCGGFFQDPTLTTITVGPPTPSIQQNNTLQMTATGTYNDGSVKTLNSNVFWSTSDSTIASISTGGLVTGLSPGTATISASSQAATGSTTVTITLANIVSIAITPTSTSITNGQTQQFTATAHLADGSTADITDSATWTSSNTSVATIDSTGLAQSLATGTTNITATSGVIVSNTATLTVN